MKPTLVILAAGLGKRFGGLKQLEPVGPGGAAIIDYTVYDAIRGGFGKVVFVLRPDMQSLFEAEVQPRFQDHISVEHEFQHADMLPEGFKLPADRQKPWGTAHAVLAAAPHIGEPFGVANADDLYGAKTLAALSTFLSEQEGSRISTYAVAGYTLRETLVESGPVARAICNHNAEGWLQRIVERRELCRHGQDGAYRDPAGKMNVVGGDELVSMNLWGFQPAVFGQLQDEFHDFLQTDGQSNTAEFLLPPAIQRLVDQERARVKVLPSSDTWCGMTYAQDKTHVTLRIAELVARGDYPEELWS